MNSEINRRGCKVIMVQGTASSAGKSVVAAALCRVYARRGLRVAPFKSQNMSLNSCVTPDGLEMGRAQGMQAEAAGVEQDVRMNPILLKPSSDHKSQVIVMGRVNALMNAKEYYRERIAFRPVIKEAFESLCAENDLIVIEGAGSPAEINLRENDLVNMGMAAMADAPVIMVGDIDRGGVFASLYGTVKLLDDADQARIKGLVINKFRGDVSILEPGLREIEELLGIPVLGVLPYVRLDIDEEDSLAPCLSSANTASTSDSGKEATEFLDIAIIRLPRISNFTDFAAFSDFPGVKTRYVSKPAELGQPHLIILPGTKSTMDDLHFLRETGFEAAILGLARQGSFIIGVCGGFQMLGKSIHDPDLVEGSVPNMSGMGLLNMRTFFSNRKKTVRSDYLAFDGPGLFKGAGGQTVTGYEIHMGESRAEAGSSGADLAVLREKGRDKENEIYRKDERIAGLLDGSGRVFGTYLHGFFDNLELTKIIINNMTNHFGLPQISDRAKPHSSRQEEYNKLADIIEQNIDIEKLDKLIGLV